MIVMLKGVVKEHDGHPHRTQHKNVLSWGINVVENFTDALGGSINIGTSLILGPLIQWFAEGEIDQPKVTILKEKIICFDIFMRIPCLTKFF